MRHLLFDNTTRLRLISQHPASAELIKPMISGENLRPWHQRNNNEYLIFCRTGTDINQYPAIHEYLSQFRERLEPKPSDWKGGNWQGRKQGTYKWYEIQDQVAYFAEFEKPKIFWSEISKLPRFSLDADGIYANNSCYFAVSDEFSIWVLLALMQSRISWFFISQVAIPLRLRGGLWQYKQFRQFIERLPIPDLSAEQQSSLAAIAEEITDLARSRYKLHEDFRRTLRSEFGGGEISTRVALYRWWEFPDEKLLSDEIDKQFSRKILMTDREEWHDYLTDKKAKHIHLTNQIIVLETRLNDIVYDAFDLTPEERALIEKATKYPYGSV